MSKKIKKIIIAYASTGSGHKSAALALCESMSKIVNPDTTEILLVDILDYFFTKIDGNKAIKLYSCVLPSVYDFT